ncbi:glycoside hydrolase family 27 protein [Athelia psychrophila]|uniref:Alpha-galactosidase n=2 Tax=Athelia psychrophila TaxID=1759441 RepID=A0A166IMR5_9AGAM|nr:glycoside hydrolase family 27 protein [Fibularhizoctonia sp. CBS 109695]
MFSLALLASLLLTCHRADALNNSVQKLPRLGYNTWNAFACNINSSVVLGQAQIMKTSGLLDAGYTAVHLDDCYANLNRTDGKIVANATKFPDGMKNFTNSIKALGFETGIYSDSGWLTCGGYPGSFNNEATDVETFAEWGFEYLKYDNCYIPFDSVTRQNELGRYQRMAEAIAAYAKKTKTLPISLALCEWGWQQVQLWGKTVAQSWRVDDDIEPFWSSIASIINQASFIAPQSDFYGHNDLDMLQVGNTVNGGNLTIEEARSHFTAWALLKSPLLIGTDLKTIGKDYLNILLNKEIIAINQDPVVGASITPFRWGINPDLVSNSSHPAQYWSGQTQTGVVFMLLNTLDTPAPLSFNLTESWAIRAGRQYHVRDLWAHTDNGTAVRNLTVTVPGHGVAALLLTDAGDEPASAGLENECAVWSQCSTHNGTRLDIPA